VRLYRALRARVAGRLESAESVRRPARIPWRSANRPREHDLRRWWPARRGGTGVPGAGWL